MSSPVQTTPFGDRLAEAAERRGTPLVLGLDPDPARLWPGSLPADPSAELALLGLGAAAEGAATRPAALAAVAVLGHCRRL
ncbi:MAG: hypothetical protein Q7T55_25830, partial [Solirubrobacteraceae bacterium]|nr:hypothetical protein [Solirubrobacteraceae bacterium]